MQTLLVTGGCGFIGTSFIRLLMAETDVRVINLDKLTYAANRANLAEFENGGRYQLVVGDIGDRGLVSALLAEHRPGAVINFAAESHVDRSIDGPGAFIQTNIVGTFALLEAVRGYWQTLAAEAKHAFRFLHVSTDEVFGSLEKNDPAFCETTAYQPNSPYSASKAASDHLVRAWHHTYGLPTLITNCSNNYGPFQFPEKLIPLMIVNALAGKPLPVYGDGQNIRDWLYVEDHGRAIWSVLNAGRVGETYAVGGNAERTNLEVVHTLCDLLQAHAPRAEGSYRDLIRFVTDRPGHDRRYAINAEKMRRELNWTPRESFETGMAKTIAWYLAHPQFTARDYQQQRLGLTA